MNELYVGLMSGTSLDAIDTVVVSIESDGIKLLACNEYTIPSVLRQRILDICTGQITTLPEVGFIDHELGKLYAAAVNELLGQAELTSNQITAIGNHGQTVFHQPDGDSPFTMQLGDANLIAALTRIDTVADFRRMDIALGGQGAPLTPAFHQFLFQSQDSRTVVLNIGGIANVTVLPIKHPESEKAEGQVGDQIEVIGFDTGPGNLLMDAWCEKHTGKAYDHDAQWAKQGTLNEDLLNQLLSDPYLVKTLPKSTGREYYHLDWLEKQLLKASGNKHVESLSSQFIAEDVQRTLCEFTAVSIAQQIHHYQEGENCELLVCGGGANNPLLMKKLQDYLPEWGVFPTSKRGVSGDYLEAMAFAWLARQRIHNQASNLRSVTGAKSRVSLGVLYPALKEFS